MGEHYRRSDGRIVTVTEIVGNAIECRMDDPPLPVLAKTFWLRRKQFVEAMEGPIVL